MDPIAGGDYSYESSGFDGFLSRSIDDLPQVTLDSPGPQSTAIPFDRGQQSGSFGNVVTIGNIQLDGVKGRISLKDDNSNEVLRLGATGDQAGDFGLQISQLGSDVKSNNLSFSSDQLSGTFPVPSVTLVDPGSGVEQTFTLTVNHSLGYVPDFSVIALAPPFANVFPVQFAYVKIGYYYQNTGPDNVSYEYWVAVDEKNLYLRVTIGNLNGNTLTSRAVFLQYYIKKEKVI